MREKLNKLFDGNRHNLGEVKMEELRNEIHQLQQIVMQQEQQLNHYQQLQQQQGQQQPPQPIQNQEQQQQNPQENVANQLVLSPESVLNQFRHLKAFKGTDEYPLSSFIKSVETALLLCNNNHQLQYFGMQIIINEKLQGEAGRCIRQLGDNPDWSTITTRLKQLFQPHRSYAELFNYCRAIKVSNLGELFKEFRNVSYELNELYEFDERKPEIYKPENVDRDLREILLEKIDGNIRAHIAEKASMVDIFNKYARLKLLEDFRTIDVNHRKGKPQKVPNQIWRPISNSNTNQSNRFTVQGNSFQNSKVLRRENYNNSGQFRTQQTFNNCNNSNQYRTPTNSYNNSRQTRHTNNTNTVERMEIGNVQETELNFQNLPRNIASP